MASDSQDILGACGVNRVPVVAYPISLLCISLVQWHGSPHGLTGSKQVLKQLFSPLVPSFLIDEYKGKDDILSQTR